MTYPHDIPAMTEQEQRQAQRWIGEQSGLHILRAQRTRNRAIRAAIDLEESYDAEDTRNVGPDEAAGPGDGLLSV